MDIEESPAWHAMRRRAVIARLGADAAGLDSQEALRRLDRYGPNSLPAPPRRGLASRILAQINSFFIYVLLACAAATLALSDYVDTAVILSVVLVNVVVGLWQEKRADDALAAIRHMLSPTASAWRDRRRVTVPAEKLVPGDVIHLERGDRVPADARLLRARGLATHEAALTGESIPVDKAGEAVPRETPLSERSCMVYAGTLVVRGSGTAMVAACGPGTELGRIGRMMAAVDPVRTPLLRKMDRFTRRVTTFVLGIGATVVLIDFVFRDRSADEAVLRGIAIAVAAIPEGLPAVLTVTLAIGVRHMAARRAIIRHMPAVEALGSVTTICSDKTGTLTRDEMVVQAVATSDATFDVTGAGYSPSGRVLRAGREIDGIGHGVLSLLGEAAGLCVDASLRHVDGQWTISGDPMEAALIAFSAKAGHAPEALRARMPRIDEIPFDARYRYMATLHRAADGRAILYVKGAPERIIEMCARQRGEAGDLPIQPAYWQTAIHAMAAQGRRILALATRDMGDARAVDAAQAESGLTMLGLVGLADPARPEAIAAVLECRRAGIVVKMITGDHPETARSIARHLGIARHEEVATGAHLDLLPDRALSKLVRTTDVFARTTPEHKLRLVRALQANGEIVAMTGDGANDAPALKRADVGIAMGRKGTDVAREAASIVLADDNFASIVAAVREGRTVYDNIRKAIAWTLPTHGGQGLFVAIAIGLGITLPVTPAQILWVNTATSATLGLTLAFENAEDDVMSRPPRAPDAPLLGGQVAWRVILVSAFFTLAAFSMYEWALQRGLDIAQAQTIVVNTVVVLDIFYLFSVRFLAGTSFTWAGARGTPAVLSGVGVTILLQLALTYLPALQALFHTRALAVRDGLAVIAVGVVFFLVLEGEKWVRLRLAGASAMGRIGRRSAP